MTDRVISERPKKEPVRNDPQSLSDTQYLAHALIEAFRLFISLALKRWPELR